jgi:hypothetical protein
VYALTPTVSGNLQLRVGFNAADTQSECVIDPNGAGCWDRMIYVRHQDGASGEAVCASVANHTSCAGPAPAPNYTNDLTIAVTAGETYYFFIDSFWDGGGNINWVSGPYNLHIYLN